MIRFHLERMNKGSVHLSCFQGWMHTDYGQLQAVLVAPGEFGMGDDPREKCLRTAEVLMLLSCERPPIVDWYKPQFCDDIIRAIESDTCHISSEDVREWILDALGEDLDRLAGTGALAPHFTREGGHVESN